MPLMRQQAYFLFPWDFDQWRANSNAGRAATTTIHDATETGVSISGIFQAAEDFAVLGWWNAYDYFNHLRLNDVRDRSGRHSSPL